MARVASEIKCDEIAILEKVEKLGPVGCLSGPPQHAPNRRKHLRNLLVPGLLQSAPAAR